ncbi:anti-CBASS protein Acb1 family protein [Paraburkholderia dilworthii]|uniref:anti-CBASS protein Acb1 family protein n=1 Tax=Paraburkholderia dilworthii TaxID=948106 RepID=UPI00047F1155|nr:anti-CBASS Acb1 family protein [Paraburkholderia dilworthii]
MAEITILGSSLSSSLMDILMADGIIPGSEPSYHLCKTIYSFHPLGSKIVDQPIKLAMSQKRKISIPNSPEERVREAFERKWNEINADTYIANTWRLAKIYGASAIVFGAKGVDTKTPIKPEELAKKELYFNALDPLNTAGSLVLNQDPNAPDFQKPTLVTAAGQTYHPSRALVFFNESPLYIEYTNSAYGYTGRSVYQRALFPLKSFVQTLIADDMVARKVGVIVAKMKPAGSIADRAMAVLQGVKRNVVKEAQTNNVINITPEEAIETLNLLNADGALTTARKNILENIAAAVPQPAKLLNSESYAEGFGEGSEDAKEVVRYIDNERLSVEPLYKFFERIVMRLAWTPEFYATVQADMPKYKGMSYNEAFYEWSNSFEATWPSLLVEPESKLVEVEKVKFETLVSALEILLPALDPNNQARAIEFFANNMNESKHLITNPLVLDYDELREYVPPTPEASPDEEPKPGRALSLGR